MKVINSIALIALCISSASIWTMTQDQYRNLTQSPKSMQEEDRATQEAIALMALTSIQDLYDLDTDQDPAHAQEEEKTTQEVDTVNDNQHNVSETQQCKICLEDRNIDELYTLSCEHAFCKVCLTHILDNVLKERNSAGLRCPDSPCKKMMDEADIQNIINDKSKIDLLRAIQLRENRMKETGARSCPTVDCDHVVITNQTRRNITCPDCDKTYCSTCLLAPHASKILCKLATKNQIADHATEIWKKQNTRECPRCSVSIEKTIGCKIMKCTACNEYFCWNCLIPLSENHQKHLCKPIVKVLYNQLDEKQQVMAKRQNQRAEQNELKLNLRRQQEIERQRQEAAKWELYAESQDNQPN